SGARTRGYREGSQASARSGHLGFDDACNGRIGGSPAAIEILPEVWLILFTAHDLPGLERLSRAAGIHIVVPKHKAATNLIAQAEALVAQSALRKGVS